jgi:Skp family chaperone for outer membrane proteins
MKFSTYVYIGAALIAAILLTASITSLWSNHKITKLEREVEAAKTTAAEKGSVADEKEKQAGEYKAKNEYLENKIAELRARANKQDEELENIKTDTDTARRRVNRARRARSIDTTAAELCSRLADLGHPCKQ